MKKNVPSFSLHAVRYCLLLIAIVFSGYANAQQVLVWEQNFNGSVLDTTTWTYEIGDGCASGNCGWGNNELEYYSRRPENVRLENGNLIIEARRESMGGKPFTSGRIKTQGRMAFKYGSLEARIKVPNVANGLWPAFWLLGATGGTWPHNGEVDILEMGFAQALANGTARRTLSSATHWWTENPGGYTGHATYAKDTTVVANLDDDYHLYKLDWDANFLVISIDGTPFYRIGIAGGNGLDAFQKQQYIVLNLAVGGNYPGIPTEAGITAPLPAQMQVDYIKLYQDITHGDEIFLAQNNAPEGVFGIFTETTPKNDSVTYGLDANLYLWNNISNITPAPAPFEGNQSWNFHANAGTWFGLGVANDTRNMVNFKNGSLKFQMKTSSGAVFKVGIATGGGEGWVNFTGNDYGLVRDGQWHQVTIPVSAFGAVDLYTVSQLFMLSGDAPATAFDFYLDDIYYTGGVAANPAPTVSITSPAANALFNTPANVSITVNAADVNGTVTKVDYYDSSNYLGSSTVAPFNFTWNNAPEGIHFLKAKATDNDGTTTTSALVKVYVAAAGNTAPVVSITSPTASSVYTKPANVNIAVNATDDGVIEKVEFYNGTTLLGTDNTAPYTFAWTGVDMGTYTITAKAYDNGQNSTVSAPVTFTVNDNVITADKYGIYSEDPTIVEKLTYGVDANLYVWNSLTNITGAAPFEGSQVLAFHAPAANWFGFGVANDIRNLTHFADGSLKLHMKTTYAGSFKFSIITTAGEGAVVFAAGEEKLGLVRDGQWHEITIPLSLFGAIDLSVVSQAFTFAGDAPAAATDFYFDNVYYTIQAPPNSLPTISITNPLNNAKIYQPNAVAFTVNAQDSDGSITKVKYFEGANLIGTSTTAPFGFNWSAPIGSFVITAKAFDNRGDSVISAPVNIEVKDASTRGPNLCLLKPAFATTGNAALAVDGNIGTRWESASADPQSIVVNMGANYNVDQVKITWEGAYGKDYEIQISTDSLNWTTLKNVTGNSTLINDWTGLTGNGKYLRILGTVRGTVYGYSIWELEAWGDNVIANTPPTVSVTAPADNSSYIAPATIPLAANASDADGSILKVEFYNGATLIGTDFTAPYTFDWTNVSQGSYTVTAIAYDNLGVSTISSAIHITVTPDTRGPNLCLLKPATASTGNAAAAVDGNIGTRWESAFADPQWITVDLGAMYNINEVKITWEGAYAEDYLVQLSPTNNEDWTTVKTVTGNNVLINDHTSLSGSGRYLRIYGTKRGTIYGYSIWELEAYGSLFTLPVTVAAISAQSEANTVRVQWNVQNETAVRSYILERSIDGVRFAALHTIAARNISTPQEYVSVDQAPLQGVNFYRVKITDIAGKITYTNIVKLNTAATTAEMNIFPNPATGRRFTLNLSGMENGKHTLSMYSVNGKLCYSRTINIASGNISQLITLPESFAAGSYYFVLTGTDGKRYTKTVLIN